MASAHACIRLCPLSALAGAEARGFDIDVPDGAHGLFVVRDGDGFRGYLNRCPHLGLPLNWLPDRFLDEEGVHILCANHGALFAVADGRCIAGPCAGDRLTPVRLLVRDGELWLDDPVRAGRG